MLVLLIIFMVAAPLATVDVAVDLPASTAEPQPRPDKPVFLTVKADLTLALGETADRARRARPARSTPPPRATRRRASSCAPTRAVPYGELMEVMNLLRSAGYLKVALVGLEKSAMRRGGDDRMAALGAERRASCCSRMAASRPRSCIGARPTTRRPAPRS